MIQEESTVVQIISQVARSFVAYTDTGEYCPYCEEENCARPVIDFQNYREYVRHTPDCVVTLARTWLRKQGTPMQVYAIDGEQRHLKHPTNPAKDIWTPLGMCLLALSEEQARSNFGENQRNIQVTCLGVLPDPTE